MSVEIIGLLIPMIALMIPVVAIIMNYYEKKAKMRTIEKAIEKGVQLDNISLGDMQRPKLPYRSGMVSLACGVGIIILGIFMGLAGGDAGISVKGATISMNALIGSGAIVALIGVALIVNDKMNISRYDNDT